MLPLESYPHVDESCTLRQAVSVFTNEHITAHGETTLPRILLVFAEDGDSTLIGMVRRRDMLMGLSPRWFFKPEATHPEAVFDIDVDANISEVLADKVVSRFRDRMDLPITEYIQPISGVVNADDTLIRIFVMLVEKGHHMLPVTEEDQVIGVVRDIEVIWAVHNILEHNTGPFDD
jgi:CBS-domain-containing membrane protein